VKLENLEREMTTLQIERESLKNESDTYSVDRLKSVDELIEKKKEEQGRLTSIWERERARVKDIKNVKRQIDEETNRLEIAQREGNFELASRLRYSTIPALKAKLPPENAGEEVENEDMMIRDRLTGSDIAGVIARSTGIPVENLRQGETEKLLHIEDALRAKIIGQDEAISSVAKAIRLSRAGLQAPNRPLSSFLMLGPSGIGKTSLTKAMAEFLFGDSKKGLIQINMSELSGKHDISRLLGATPGYVGYEEGGQLTNAVKRRPYAVVVLDEIEKAHPDIQNILLQILEEGELTDGQGGKVSFKNTIICLTSNLGSPEFQKAGATKNGTVTPSTKKSVMEYVTSWFRPEVLGRLDETIIFNSLPRSAVDDIVRLRLSEVQSRIDERHIKLNVDQDAVHLLGDMGFSEQYGARAVARVIRDEVVTKLTLALLEGRIRNGDTVRVTAKDGAIAVQDNHERDTAKGGHVLDVAEEVDTDESNSSSLDVEKKARVLPILEDEVNRHDWTASADAAAVTISSETSPGKLILPYNWLRDNCPCPLCSQQSTRQRLHRSSDYLSTGELVPEQLEMRTVDKQIGLSVSWSGIHATSTSGVSHAESFFPLRDLARQQQSSVYTRQEPIFFPTKTWDTTQGLLDSPTLRIPYEEFKTSPTAMLAALAQVTSYGMVVLTGVPTEKTDDAGCELRAAMEKIGELRHTFYGETWNVKALKDSKNIAYTDVDLGFHQDLL
jgi:ATP-dependent protease Clp ATPase subunit